MAVIAKITGSTGFPLTTNKPDFSSNENDGSPATLIIHDGPPEIMFTESEVRAILRDLLAAAEDGPFMPNYDRMDEMVKFHGLSFDPA